MQFPSSLALLGLAALGQAHIIITTPLPFKESVSTKGGDLDNAPLDRAGTNFPCKSQGTYTPQGPSTPMALGSMQPLVFQGGATHGGGSCQISITYDAAPTKNSVWKVIHSIQGACPIASDGNLSDNAQGKIPTAYQFPIPNELPTGEAVLAWTWFNKIGNREMYMNCAPITITGASARRDEGSLETRNATQLFERDMAAFNSLPDMFKANILTIGNDECGTVDSKDVQFPNPGSSVENPLGSAALTPPLHCSSAAGPVVSQPASSVTSIPATSAAGPAPSASSSGSIPGGVFFPDPKPTVVAPSVSASATAAPISSVPATSVPVVAPSPTQATTFTVVPTKPTSVSVAPKPSSVSAAPPAGTGTVGGGSQLTGSCSTEGSWNCIGGSSFQRCASGTWSVAMLVAAGTQCTPGESTSFGMKAIAAKRNIRFSGAHIRRHAHRS